MPKINVYLPDDLAAAVRATGVPVSAVCQKALGEAVRGIETARKAVAAIRDPRLDAERMHSIGDRLASRMTPRLRQAMEGAWAAAGAYRPVQTSHLLIGLLDEGDNLGIRLLSALGVDADRLRGAVSETEVEETDATEVPRGDAHAAGTESGSEAPGAAGPWAALTAPARRAIASALEASIDLGHNYLGCEHLLLGLLEDEESGAGQVLRRFGVDPASGRRAVTSAVAGAAHVRETLAGAAASTLEEVLRRLDTLERRLGSSGS